MNIVIEDFCGMRKEREVTGKGVGFVAGQEPLSSELPVEGTSSSFEVIVLP